MIDFEAYYVRAVQFDGVLEPDEWNALRPSEQLRMIEELDDEIKDAQGQRLKAFRAGIERQEKIQRGELVWGAF